MIDLRKPAKLAWQELEHKFQLEAAKWTKRELYKRGLPQVFYHVPNERKASKRELSQLKLQGVLSGVSDVVIPLKAGEYSGLYCELKKAGGSASPEQKVFLEAVALEGFLAVVINDLQTYIETVTAYLDLRK